MDTGKMIKFKFMKTTFLRIKDQSTVERVLKTASEY
jgi:hypothetical protein